MNSGFNVHDYGVPRDTEHLSWKRKQQEEVFRNSFFHISSARYARDDGREGNFLRLDCADWANVCAVHENSRGEDCLVLVRQFRHGCDEISLEVPGGYLDAGEEHMAAARRELHEETGFRAGTIEHIGAASPNAAFMGNKLHVFLARELHFDNVRNLDANEVIDVELVPIPLIARGQVPEFMVNGIMGISWYFFDMWMKRHGGGRNGGGSHGNGGNGGGWQHGGG